MYKFHNKIFLFEYLYQYIVYNTTEIHLTLNPILIYFKCKYKELQ